MLDFPGVSHTKRRPAVVVSSDLYHKQRPDVILKEIVMSEIEAREYAPFVQQPVGIQLRPMADDGMAGVYGEEERSTTRYSPSAYVFSISINGAGKKFSSAYTDLKSDCTNPTAPSPQGRHSSLYCKGQGGYRIHIFDSAMSLHVNVETVDKKVSIPLTTQRPRL